MEFSVIINKGYIHDNECKCKNTIQITLDDDFNVPDNKADIEHIIRQWGNARIDEAKALGEKAEVKGCLDFAILYMGNDEDGDSMPFKMTGDIDIGEVINLSCDVENIPIYWETHLEDLTVKAINSRKINVKAIISIKIVCEDIEDYSFGYEVSEVQENECIQVKKQNLQYAELMVNMRDNLRIRETVSLPQGKPNIGSIMWEELWIRSFDSKAVEDGMEINIELGYFIIYVPENSDIGTAWYDSTANFNGKLDISGCNMDMIHFVNYAMTSCGIEAKPNYDGELRDLNLEMVLEMNVKCYQERTQQIIDDIYSPVKRIGINSTPVSIKNLIARNNSRCQINERVKTDKYGSILQIISCNGVAHIDDIQVEKDGLQVEGVVIVNTFYVSESDANPLGSFSIPIPFSHKVQLKTTEDMEYYMQSCVEHVGIVMTGSQELEVKGNVVIDVICFNVVHVNVVQECEVNEGDENMYLNLPTMVGYISDGKNSLWDIAKKYNTTVDSIKKDNKGIPELADADYKIKAGEKLLLMKELSMKEA